MEIDAMKQKKDFESTNLHIGDYLTKQLEKDDIKKKDLYGKVKDFYIAAGKDYVTYQRFCSKFSENSFTAEELILICNLANIGINKLTFFANMKIKAIFRNSEYRKDEQKEKQIIEKFNDNEFLEYLKFVNSNIDTEKHKILSMSKFAFLNKEKHTIKVNLFGYSKEENVLINEILKIEIRKKKIIYCKSFDCKELDKFLSLENYTVDKFLKLKDREKFDLLTYIYTEKIFPLIDKNNLAKGVEVYKIKN